MSAKAKEAIYPYCLPYHYSLTLATFKLVRFQTGTATAHLLSRRSSTSV